MYELINLFIATKCSSFSIHEDRSARPWQSHRSSTASNVVSYLLFEIKY